MLQDESHHPKTAESVAPNALFRPPTIRGRLIRLRHRLPRWHKLKTWHHRVLARYLERRGWVVFYLEDNNDCRQFCWLRLYREERQRSQ